MTKNKKILLGVMGAAALATAPIIAVSCGGGNKKELTKEEIKALPTLEYPTLAALKDEDHSSKKIAIMMTDPENPRWKKALALSQEAMTKAGFTTVNAQQKKEQNDQNSWLEAQINENASGILLGATDKGAQSVVYEAGKKNIPVVAYDRLIPGVSPTYNWYVTFDNYKVGESQGLAFLSGVYKYVEAGEGKDNVFDTWEVAKAWIEQHKLQQKGYFFVVGGDADDNNAPLFYAGAMKMVEAAQKLDANLINKSAKTFKDVATPKWDYKIFKDKLSSDVTNMSAEDKKLIVGVVSPNDGMAEAAVQTFTDAGLDFSKITITGQDSNATAYNFIKEGKQFMTIAKPDDRPSQVAAILMRAILRSGRTDITVEEAKAALDKENLPFTYKIVADDINYAVHNGKNKKFIKTVIIEPKIIVKSNVEEIKPAKTK